MFVHTSVIWLVPEMAAEGARNLLCCLEQEGIPPIKGLRHSCLLESTDEPGRLLWLSWWDAQADVRAFLTSLDYARAVSALKPYLLSGPQWRSYRIVAG
jgi:heme-degrading monooxygenase HmoA